MVKMVFNFFVWCGNLGRKNGFLIKYPEEIVRMGNESYNIACEKFDVNKINPVLEEIIVGSKL